MKFIQVHKFKFINGKLKPCARVKKSLNVPCREAGKLSDSSDPVPDNVPLARDTNNFLVLVRW